MAKGYVHLVARVSGRFITTVCGLTGSGGFYTTNRYQGSTCGKCRRIASKGGK